MEDIEKYKFNRWVAHDNIERREFNLMAEKRSISVCARTDKSCSIMINLAIHRTFSRFPGYFFTRSYAEYAIFADILSHYTNMQLFWICRGHDLRHSSFFKRLACFVKCWKCSERAFQKGREKLIWITNWKIYNWKK